MPERIGARMNESIKRKIEEASQKHADSMADKERWNEIHYASLESYKQGATFALTLTAPMEAESEALKYWESLPPWTSETTTKDVIPTLFKYVNLSVPELKKLQSTIAEKDARITQLENDLRVAFLALKRFDEKGCFCAKGKSLVGANKLCFLCEALSQLSTTKEDDKPLCRACNGSGEGYYTTNDKCLACDGKGIEK